MKGLIVYKGKYGATRQYALWLGDVKKEHITPLVDVLKHENDLLKQ